MALALFDLDNTLVDRTAAFGRAVPWLCEVYGLPAEAHPFIIDADRDGTATWQVWMGATIERYGLDTTVDDMRARFRPAYLTSYALEPAVAEGLRGLRAAGWHLGVVTNGPPSQVEKIHGTGLAELVDGWAVSEEVGARKPDRRIFEVAADRCGAALDGGWMVGDSADADMAGGRAAGLRCIWLHRGRPWDERSPSPDHQVDGPVAAIEVVGASAREEPTGPGQPRSTRPL